MPAGADFIVIGSGSGGAAVARRLCDSGAAVTLIEAGRDPVDAPEVADPAQWVGLQGGVWDWGQSYAPDPSLGGRSIPIPRGLALGGSSATNAMMWYRGTPADYARWDAVAPGWDWASCLPAFRACETWEGGPSDLRGGDGPLRITRADQDHPLTQAMLAGGDAMGLPVVSDPNGPEPEGVGLANFNIHVGRRWTSADGYLRPVADRIRILTRTHVDRLVFDGDRVTAVDCTGPEGVCRIEARQGVILASGAIETPRILMLAGIGPEAELQRLNLPCRVKSEEVGANLQDHPLIRALNMRAKRSLGPVKGNGGGTLTIWKSDADLPEADLLAFPIQHRSATPDLAAAHDLSGDVFAIGLGLMRVRSRGSVRLTGTAPDAPLHIRPGLLSDPSERAALRRGIADLQAMVEGPVFADLFAGHAAPDTRVDAKGADAFIDLACSTFFHCTGTARMGADDAAVTDPRLRVRGTRGLWIADASVMPEIPACHTHAPTTMIGERAAGFILEDT